MNDFQCTFRVDCRGRLSIRPHLSFRCALSDNPIKKLPEKIGEFMFQLKSCLCLLAKCCECSGVCDGDFGEHLSVEVDACLLEAVHKC